MFDVILRLCILVLFSRIAVYPFLFLQILVRVRVSLDVGTGSAVLTESIEYIHSILIKEVSMWFPDLLS